MWRILHGTLVLLIGVASGCVEPDLYVTGAGETTEPPTEEAPSAVADGPPAKGAPISSP